MNEPTFVTVAALKKGMTAIGFYLVKNMAIKVSANNKMYGDYTLADQTGEINAKLWDVSDPEACPQVGAFLKVQGLVTEWQGHLQFRMDRFREAREDDPVKMGDLVPSAPEEPEDMLAELDAYAARIQHEGIRAIAQAVLEEKRAELEYYPAAVKNHHSIRAGLAYHTLSMLRLSDGIMQVYDFLNPDLLYCGIILHDMAKTVEIEAGVTGVGTKYSTEGMLLGHIVQGITWVDRVGRDLGVDEEVVMMLEHMILSHHYEPEYGSPRRPMFPEGEVLHYLDMLDARMYDMHKALSSLQGGEFSENIWTLDNRKLYKATFS